MNLPDKNALFVAGVARMKEFCALNGLPEPDIRRLARTDRLYAVATCAFYRPTTITITVEKCGNYGFGGRAWSWPGYIIDRTPYGVIQHELGHHVDLWAPRGPQGQLISRGLHEDVKEAPLTGYLGTDNKPVTYYMEWFAELFRLFVTNPDLCRQFRPRFYAAMIRFKFQPLTTTAWDEVLAGHGAPARITEMAAKKIQAGKPATQSVLTL